jgi:DNA invertase Pin-like site-specific DNA recombinase
MRGRKPKLSAEQIKDVQERVNAGGDKAALAQEYNVSVSTIFRITRKK